MDGSNLLQASPKLHAY